MSAELLARFVKRYSDLVAVEADLRQPTDRFSVTVLFGPSGCGKTTTLRCLAGLERPEVGFITFGLTPWLSSDREVCLTPQQRDVGFLFQDYALFPHLTVARNVAYGLGGVPREERRRRVADILDRFQISGLEGRYPHQISGGQQQRVALARVLVRRPKLLLLDEPLSALDEPTRVQLRGELRRLLAGFGVPVVLVTHDRNEALALADHLIVQDRGKVLQRGAARDVFARPADQTVARLVGVETVVPGRIVSVQNGVATVAIGEARLSATVAGSAGPTAAGAVHVCIRGEGVSLGPNGRPAGGVTNRLRGEVRSLTPEGPLVRVELDCGFPLTGLLLRSACEGLDLREGAHVTASVAEGAVHLIVPEVGRKELKCP